MRRWLVLAVLVTTAALHAQTNAAFEVTSVKPNDSGTGGVAVLPAANGGWRARNIPLGLLIRIAFQMQEDQIVGGPSWLFQDRFDVVGTGGADGAQLDKLKTLLADRFHLRTHREKRTLAIYELVLARRDGTLGSQLTPSSIDCAAFARSAANGTVAPPRPGERPTCGFARMPGKFMVSGQSMAAFAENLSPLVGKTVVDRTNLTGFYDVTLTYSADSVVGGRGELPPLVNGAPPTALPDAPSIFQAVQEQLGLKLEPTKGQVDVLVIDHVEKPMPD